MKKVLLLGISLVMLCLPIQAQTINYDNTAWINWLANADRAQLISLWNQGYLESVLIAGKSHYRAEFPSQKTWNINYSKVFLSDSTLLWTAGEMLESVEDSTIIEPDTIITETWQFGSPAKLVGKNKYIKQGGKYGKIVLKGKKNGGKQKGWRISKTDKQKKFDAKRKKYKIKPTSLLKKKSKKL